MWRGGAHSVPAQTLNGAHGQQKPNWLSSTGYLRGTHEVIMGADGVLMGYSRGTQGVLQGYLRGYSTGGSRAAKPELAQQHADVDRQPIKATVCTP